MIFRVTGTERTITDSLRSGDQRTDWHKYRASRCRSIPALQWCVPVFDFWHRPVQTVRVSIGTGIDRLVLAPTAAVDRLQEKLYTIFKVTVIQNVGILKCVFWH